MPCPQIRVTHVSFRVTSSSATQDRPDVETSALDLLPGILCASDHTDSFEDGRVRTGLYYIHSGGKNVVRLVSRKASDTSIMQALFDESLKFALHPLEQITCIRRQGNILDLLILDIFARASRFRVRMVCCKWLVEKAVVLPASYALFFYLLSAQLFVLYPLV